MLEAFRRCGLDRNTIVVNAPIAEIAIASEKKFKSLLRDHGHEKLAIFAKRCSGVINRDFELQNQINSLKESGKLLPIKKKGDLGGGSG